ncbi:hypothetical protein O1L60_42165 [Streptomyces diastatochromogenes]|nr:hypothetical protein [Streptomyces diastatochromogenes]
MTTVSVADGEKAAYGSRAVPRASAPAETAPLTGGPFEGARSPTGPDTSGSPHWRPTPPGSRVRRH